MAQVLIENVSKKYGDTEVINGLDLEVGDGEFLVLVGPSGCGKSTLLRMIAGLEGITGGTLKIGDRTVNFLEPKDRNIAMVFQNYALYPHMNVYKNISFGLRAQKMPKDQIDKKVNEVAEILELTDLLKRKPAELSGGQRQRVAMGRAMVRDPEVFLFDEPLSNLDAKLRGSMRVEIKKLHERLKKTTIYVTHDQVEAMTLADRIVIMKDGEIQQVGTPMEVYKKPANKFVAGFIGSPEMNFMEYPDFSLGIRPEDIYIIGTQPSMKRPQKMDAKVLMVETLGADSLIRVENGKHELTVKVPGIPTINPGDMVPLVFDKENMHRF